MFPNQSSSYYEISKNNVAFVQIQVNYKGDSTGDVSGMAQPPMSNNPPFQVPDKRDEMVVSTGASVATPNLTVIAGHPSHAPTKLPSAHVCERGSDGSSRMPGVERLTGALCFDSIKSISSINYLTSDKDLSNLMKKNPTQSSTLDYIPQANDEPGDDSFKYCDDVSEMMKSKPGVLRLRGGGETSLTGTAGWGSPPAAQSGSTGWNGGSSQAPPQPSQQQQNNPGNNTSGNQGTGQPQSWGPGNNNNNNPNNNNNANRLVSSSNTGTGQQVQGPPSQNQAPATTPVSNAAPPTNNPSTTQTNANQATSGNNNTPGQQPPQNGPTQNGTANPQQPGSAQPNGGNAPNASNTGSSWAAAAGKGLPASTQGAAPAGNPAAPASSTSTKQQMEQLNTMREALFSQDGWGGQNVNQDSSWDIPGSPEPGAKDGTTTAPGPLWKVPINNGTDLWEANLRNGGNPPPQNTTQKAPWGHTPSNNIGGTWGEEDEGDSSNVWTGVPPAPTGSAPQWPNQPPPIWPGGGGAKKDGEWGGPNWNEQRGDPRDLRHGEMRQIIEARDNMRPNSVDHRSMGGNDVLMRGGITGRLNGVTNDAAMWNAGPGLHPHMPHHPAKINHHPNQPGVNQWASGNGPPLKDLSSIPKANGGWEEPSPPAQRRNMPNYDDGTSLWGAQQHTRPAMQGGNKVSHWKEMPATAAMGRGLPCPPGRGNSNMKPDQPLWPHHPRNNGWNEGAGMVDVGGPWADEKPAPWMDQSGLNQPAWVQSGPKHKPSWDGSDLDPTSWVGHPNKQSSRAQQTQQPSPQQLRMLVQQIQMAVQSGFLSPQILNQPLAPQTLLLLNQLLQQIKTLHQLNQQMQHHQVMASTLGKPSSSNQVLQISVQITKTKQQITNLQNQIAAQQAVYVKHAQQTPPTDFFNKHEPINLHPSFSDLSMKDTHGSTSTSQQSRLNQWKLPALDKDSDIGSANPDFSRAPGTTTKATPGNSSPNMNPLLGQPDGTWSSVSRDTGWPDSGTDDNSSKDWPSSTQQPSQAFSDLVPEFEPGKPWKGNPLKSIEDDPSLTPGSVMPSPLSLPSLKDTHILSSSSSVPGKASPTTSSSLDLCPPLPLSSSTWSFNPPVSSTSGGLSKLSGANKSISSSAGGGATTGATWSEGNSAPGQPGSTSSSELWAPPKRPPPGLSAKPGSGGSQGQQSQGNNSGGPTSNGWLSSSRWGGPQNSWSHIPPSGQAGSTWLLLRNLTPQIDGSTLKTLCLQHGPLQNFHLYLNHGIALAKYASREEANKAQGALNNCVLGNTTIFAESPSETDVLQLLQHLGHSTGGGQNSAQSQSSWRPGGKPEPSFSQGLWAGGNGGNSSSGNSLWGDSSDQHRTTPSSINSFLPGDLLGEGSI